jgi:hypothetical protein
MHVARTVDRPVQGPFEFETPTFVSALRLGTLYEHPALRTYAIKHLERAALSPIERIRIARECNLQEWEEPAYAELSEREEMISPDEAGVLGLETYINISRRREEVLRKKVNPARSLVCGSSPDYGCSRERLNLKRSR